MRKGRCVLDDNRKQRPRRSGEERVASPNARAPFRSTTTDHLSVPLATLPPSDPRVITGVSVASQEGESPPFPFREKVIHNPAWQ